ncbi:MAG: hypothetical protein IJZ53_01690 [Tyzzerella sp.]|nr:hypothetical protein [Tyzzerella sp.]
MNIKKKHTIIIIAVFAVLLLTGGILTYLLLSREPVEVIAKAENTYEKEYRSFCTHEHDKDMKIDGVLDEQAWQDKEWFSNTYLINIDNNMPVMKVTGFTTDYGIYFASVVEDENIVNNGQRSTGYNSMFEFEITADNVGETRVNDGLYKTKYIIDMRADCISRDPNFDRAVVVDGEINSGETKGATLEAFIPWEQLKVDTSKGIPTEFRLMPSYRAVLTGDETTTVLLPVVYTTINTQDFYRFGKTGYLTPDREGAVIGDSKFGNAKTGNWDVSQEENGIVRSSLGYEHHKIFFTEEHGANFIVETTIVPVKALDNAYPKAGIYFQSTDTVFDSVYHTVLLNMQDVNLVDSVNGTKNFVSYQLASLNNENAGWNQKALLETYEMMNEKASAREGVKLTVIKYGDKFWYFADGKFLTQEVKSFMDTDVIPGFYALGGDAIFKDSSCEAIDEDTLKSYLKKEGLYLVDAKTKGSQGTVVSSAASVEKGSSYNLTITSKSGYQVSSVLINGKEMIKDFRKNGNGGVYTVNNVKEHQEIVVAFEKIEGVKFSGKVTDGDKAIVADVTLSGISDKSLKYQVTSSGEKGYNVVIPAGTYRVSVTATNYKPYIEEKVTIKGDKTKNYTLSLSDFPASVEVNGKKIASNLSVWNTVLEGSNKILGSYAAGTKHKPLYFSKTAKDFAVEFTAAYTTNFQEGGSYQPDLMAGFMFNDGTNESWIYARDTGVVTTGWKFTNGLTDEAFLRYPDKKPVTFGLAKKGSDVYIYLNGEFAYKMSWSQIAANTSADSEVAIGIMMLADKTADIEITNWKLAVGTSAADKYIKDGVLVDAPVDGSSLFAKSVTVNNVQIKSMLAKWDLSEVSKNIVKGSFAMGSKLQPLYFTKTGNTALMKAKIEYTTNFKDGVNYQPDLMGGFTFSDGKNTGWLLADRTGLCCTNWQFYQNLVKDKVLTYPEKRSVEMTVALKDNYFYVYFDDTFVYRIKASKVIPNAADDATLAMGITMMTDKTADIRFSNISISTNADDVNSYIGSHSSQSDLVPVSIRNDIDYARQLGKGVEIDSQGKTVSTVNVNENTTIFIGDSFFDRRNFWTDFYSDDYAGKNAFLAGIGGTRCDQWELLIDEVFAAFGNKAPKNIAIHLGTNDLATGYSVEMVTERLQELIMMLHNRYPETNIYYFGITQRGNNAFYEKIKATNSNISAWCEAQNYITYIDTPSKITASMLQADKLHPKLESYAVFVEELEKAGCVIENK